MSKKALWLGGGLGLALVIGGLLLSKKSHRLTPFIRDLYRRVARHFPFKAPPLVEDRSVDNAQSDGATIRVNPAWVEQALASGCDDEKCTWSFVLGVMAHELGHHAHRVEGSTYDGHGEELRADEIAGRVLALEGVGASDFARILGHISGLGSETHPDGYTRMAAIQRGYNSVRYLV